MSIEKTLILRVDSKGAEQSVEKLSESVEDLNKDIDKLGKNSKEDLGDLRKEAKKADKSMSGLKGGINKASTAVKGFGLALKAAGIGLIIGAIATLTEVFKQNQKVVDIFETAMNAANIVVNDFVDFVSNNFGKVTDFFKDVFENPVENIKAFGKAIKDNLIERFNSFIDTLGFLGEGIKNLFSGDFDAAIESFKNAGKEAVDVVTGVPDTVDKASAAIKNLTESVVEYNKEVFTQANAITQSGKAAEVAAGKQGLLTKQYEVQAEKLRQLRDDENRSIEDRIKSNNELSDVLKKQAEEERKQAQAQLDNAELQLSANKDNVELQRAVFDARANLVDVEARITGFMSEQKTNAVSLQRELRELNTSAEEFTDSMKLEQTLFDIDADAFSTELEKITQRNKANQEFNDAEVERLQRLVEETVQGTQARQDAEQLLADAQEKRRQDTITGEQLLRDERLLIKQEEYEREIELEQALADEKMRINMEYISFAQNLSGLLSVIGQKNKAIATAALVLEKGAAIAGIIIKTQEANAKIASGLAAASTLVDLKYAPVIGGAAIAAAEKAVLKAQATKNVATNNIMSGLSIATIAASSLSGSRNVGGGGGVGSFGGGGIGSAPSPQAPQFNVVGASGESQLATLVGESVGEQINDRPIRTYVVSSEVTSAQALDRNVENSASI